MSQTTLFAHTRLAVGVEDAMIAARRISRAVNSEQSSTAPRALSTSRGGRTRGRVSNPSRYLEPGSSDATSVTADYGRVPPTPRQRNTPPKHGRCGGSINNLRSVATRTRMERDPVPGYGMLGYDLESEKLRGGGAERNGDKSERRLHVHRSKAMTRC